MSCDEVRAALPLLAGGDPDEAARARAHCAGCPACAAELAGYDADARAFDAVRAVRDAAPPALDGFTASVMARLQAEPAAAPARAPGHVIAFPSAWRATAAAAAVLLGVAVGLGSGAPAPTPAPAPVATAPAPAPAPVELGPTTPAPSAPAPVAVDALPALAAGEAVPAPARVRAPRVARRGAGDGVVPVGGVGPVDGVVPVDGGRGRGFPQGMLPGGLFEDLERILPELQRRMERRGPADGAREVKF